MRKVVLALVIVAAVLGGSGRAVAAAPPSPPAYASCIAALAAIYTGGNVDEAVAQFQAIAQAQGIPFGQLVKAIAQTHDTAQACLALPPNP